MRWTLMQIIWTAIWFLPMLDTLRISAPRPGVRYQAGRRCLLGSAYVLPRDASENERLDAQHHLLRLVLGSNYLAPLLAPRAILDVGCGTGKWCREMGHAFPTARIIGFDLDARMIEETATQQANVFWQQGNALAPLPFVDGSFDYVHQRFAATWLPWTQWLAVLHELLRVTRPGGWIELVEGAMPTSADTDYQALCQTMDHLLKTRGLSAQVAQALLPLAEAIGLIRLGHHTYTTGSTQEQQYLLFETTRQGFASLLPILKQHLAPRDLAAYQEHLAAVEWHAPLVTRTDVVVWGQKPT